MAKRSPHLPTLNPRTDLNKAFYPTQLEPRHPALLTSSPLLSTALVATRLLNIIAVRGGTRLKPTWIQRISTLLQDALSPEALIHCDAEVDRILEWLEGRAEMQSPTQSEHQQSPPSPTPELDIMHAAELQTRISVAQLAINENYDLQLEYYDETTRTWPRLRATPLEIITDPDANADTSPQLNLAIPEEKTRTITFKSIRWLMPVTRHQPDPDPDPKTTPTPPQTGRLLTFPDISRPDKQ